MKRHTSIPPLYEGMLCVFFYEGAYGTENHIKTTEFTL